MYTTLINVTSKNMYSQSARVPWFKSAIVSIIIFAMVFTVTPQPSEGVILAIIAASAAAPLAVGAVITAIVADLVIICVLGGLGCGGSDGDGNPGSNACVATSGDPCTGPNPTCSSEDLEGIISCDGSSCAVDPSLVPPASCTSSPNLLCGRTGTGTNSCGTCSATTPSDSQCLNIALDDPDSLTITPELVREGSIVTINWDLKTNYPPSCTISGPMSIDKVISNTSPGDPANYNASRTVFTFSDSNDGAGNYTDSTGTMEIRVTGPHRYTLECGGASIQNEVQVLPTVFES